jgi:hypothetical protein
MSDDPKDAKHSNIGIRTANVIADMLGEGSGWQQNAGMTADDMRSLPKTTDGKVSTFDWLIKLLTFHPKMDAEYTKLASADLSDAENMQDFAAHFGIDDSEFDQEQVHNTLNLPKSLSQDVQFVAFESTIEETIQYGNSLFVVMQTLSGSTPRVFTTKNQPDYEAVVYRMTSY